MSLGALGWAATGKEDLRKKARLEKGLVSGNQEFWVLPLINYVTLC